MSMKTEGKGMKFGRKTATLEMIGVNLPVLLITNKLDWQHGVPRVDNLGCVSRFTNHDMKGDVCASIH
jgi:hypothetical protein